MVECAGAGWHSPGFGLCHQLHASLHSQLIAHIIALASSCHDVLIDKKQLPSNLITGANDCTNRKYLQEIDLKNEWAKIKELSIH